jgi:hypothetical protein
MSLEDLGNIGEFVAAVAVVVSLVYLAVQIRQNSRWLRASIVQAVAGSFMDFNQTVAANPQLMRVYQIGLEDFARLSEEERRQFLHLITSVFRFAEQMFYQYRRGTLEEQMWQGYAENILFIYQQPSVRQWWEIRRGMFSEEFREYLANSVPREEFALASEVITRISQQRASVDGPSEE